MAYYCCTSQRWKFFSSDQFNFRLKSETLRCDLNAGEAFCHPTTRLLPWLIEKKSANTFQRCVFLDFLLGHDIDSNYGSAAWEPADIHPDRVRSFALLCTAHGTPANIPQNVKQNPYYQRKRIVKNCCIYKDHRHYTQCNITLSLL